MRQRNEIISVNVYCVSQQHDVFLDQMSQQTAAKIRNKMISLVNVCKILTYELHASASVSVPTCFSAGSCCPQVRGQKTDREETSQGSEGKTSGLERLGLTTISVFTQRERLKHLQCGRNDVTTVRRPQPETLLTEEMFHFFVLLWFDTFIKREENDQYVFSFLAQTPYLHVWFFC